MTFWLRFVLCKHFYSFFLSEHYYKLFVSHRTEDELSLSSCIYNKSSFIITYENLIQIVIYIKEPIEENPLNIILIVSLRRSRHSL